MNLKYRTIISQQFDYRKNALNTLKIIAALQVAYGHMIVHLQVDVPSIISRVFGFFMGVPIFFILSGFLIWNSVGKSKNAKDYAIKRATRIFPELWIGVVIEIILLLVFLNGAINWLMLGVFAFGQSTVFQFYTPDFLRVYGCGTPNGALWTLGVTIQFYCAVWFIYKLMHNKNIRWWLSVLTISIAIKAASPYIANALPELLGKLWNQTLLPYLWMFIFGAFLAQYKDKAIPFLKKTWWILLGISLVIGILKLDIDSANYGVFKYLFRVSGFIGLCYNIPAFNIKFDFSYGLYIYHMIIVNLMIELGFIGKWYHLIIAMVVSVAVACASTCAGNYISDIIGKKRQWRKNYEHKT